MCSKNAYFLTFFKFKNHLFFAKKQIFCPNFDFVFRKKRKFRPNFDFVFREISRNSREISRITKLKILRTFREITQTKIFAATLVPMTPVFLANRFNDTRFRCPQCSLPTGSMTQGSDAPSVPCQQVQ